MQGATRLASVEATAAEKAPGGAVAGGAGEVAAGPCVSPAPPMPKGDRPALFELLDAERHLHLEHKPHQIAVAFVLHHEWEVRAD